MKAKNKLYLVVFMPFILGACNSANLGEEAEVSEAREVNTINATDDVLKININNSIVEWTGSKPTGTHHGTIELKDGALMMKDGQIAGGEFIIDMKSIENHDLESEEWNSKLVNHLHSGDFFSTDLHPHVKFVITGVEEFTGVSKEESQMPTHTITGNFTIKDITKSIRFNAIISMDENSVTAESVPFMIDRTKWDVKYKSNSAFDNLKDDFIHDDIGLKVKLQSSLES